MPALKMRQAGPDRIGFKESKEAHGNTEGGQGGDKIP